MLFTPAIITNIGAICGGGAAAWTPNDLTNSIWFDGSDTTKIRSADTNAETNPAAISNGADVYDWTAKGSYSSLPTVKMVTSANRPVWNSGGYLTFNGTSDYLSVASALYAQTDLNSRSGYTAYAVVKANPGTADFLFSEDNSANSAVIFSLLISSASTASTLACAWRADDNGSIVGSTQAQATSVWDNTKKIVGGELAFNGTSPSYNYYDGSSFSAGTLPSGANADTTTVDQFTIGAQKRDGVGNWMPMDLYQLVICDDVLSSDDRTALLSFLGNY